MSVCLSVSVTPLERLFVLKTLSHTQRATKVKIFVGFSLKPLRCRDPAFPPMTAIRTGGHFFVRKARMRIIVFFLRICTACVSACVFLVYNYTRMIHRRGFSTLVLFIMIVILTFVMHVTCM